MSEGSGNWGSNIVFIITFLGLFFILIGSIPAWLYYGGDTYVLYNTPASYWDFIHVTDYAYIENDTLSGIPDSFYLNFSTLEEKFRVNWYAYAGGINENIMVYRRSWIFLGLEFYHPCAFDIKQGEAYTDRLFIDDLTDNFDSSENVTEVEAYRDGVTLTLWFQDSNTTRNDLDEAWNTDESIDVIAGMGYEESHLKTGAWDTVARLLTFQPVDIFSDEANPPSETVIVNSIIALPIWAMIGYLVYRLVLLAIPFV